MAASQAQPSGYTLDGCDWSCGTPILRFVKMGLPLLSKQDTEQNTKQDSGQDTGPDSEQYLEQDTQQDAGPHTEHYTETPKEPGIVYMFMQKDFKDHVPRKEEDIEADVKNIRTCFEKLGYFVAEPMKNKETKEITDYLDNVRDYISSKYERMFVFVVTHSKAAGKLLCVDGEISEEDIITTMKGEKYAKLLKLFIFQASQAAKDPGAKKGIEKDGDGGDSYPDEANLFVIKSSFELALPTENGSFFLKVFCKLMENNRNESLFNIIPKVLSELKAKRNESISPESRNNILPELTSTLLKPMFLCSGEKPTSVYQDQFFSGKLIVLNYNYTCQRSLYPVKEYRDGTQYDVKAIEKSFGSVGFNVQVNNDLQADVVRTTMKKGVMCAESSCNPKCDLRHNGEAPTNYSDDTCIAVAIMTHGHNASIKTTSEDMTIAEVINKLILSGETSKEREDLSGKPKIFMLQVCRKSTESVPYNKPLDYDDVLVFHSSYHGKLAERDPQSGTMFIQILCKKIDEIEVGKFASLIDIFQGAQDTFVNEYPSAQIPVIYSTLTKNLFISKQSTCHL